MSAGPRPVRRRLLVALGVGLGLGLCCLGSAVAVGIVAEKRAAERPAFSVELVAAGDAASAPATERSMAIPVERAVRGVHGVGHVRVRSAPHVAQITCVADGTVDPGLLQAAVVRAATGAPLGPDAMVTHEAPADVVRPVRRLVVGGGLVEAARHALVVRLTDAIERASGVAAVRTCGDTTPSLRVLVDPARLAARGVTLEALRTALVAVTLPLGGPGGPLALRVSARPIGGAAVPTTVADVATVSRGASPGACRAYRQGGGEVTTLDVLVWRAETDRAGVGARVDAAIGTVTASRGAVWTFPARGVASGVVLTPVSVPEDTWRATTRLADTLRVAGAREVIVQSQSPAPDVPADAVRLDVVGGTAPVVDAVAAVPGFLYVPDGEGRTVRVLGNVDLATLRETARDVRAALAGSPDVSAAILDVGDRPRLDVELDRARAARYGVSAGEVELAVALATQHEHFVEEARDGEEPVAVVLALPDGTREDRLALPLVAAGGVRVPLTQLTTARMETEPAQVVRWDGRRAVEVRAWGPARALSRAIDALPGLVRLRPGVVLEAPP